MEQDIEKIKNLEEELKRTRAEFRMFYEISQALRSTLNLDEILYIILTGITAHQGLGFNRAALFFVYYNQNKIKGIMGIGPAKPQEAQGIWNWIEQEKKDLHDLIKEYHTMKTAKDKPTFFELVKNLEFPLSKEAGIIYQAFTEGMPLQVRSQHLANVENDFLYKAFLFEEAVLVPLWTKNQVIAALFVDNFVTKKPINPQDINILNMFASQASLAIENSKLFEDTLFKAHTDSLTGLWNYGYFQYRLDEQIEYSLRFNKNLCLLMIDIDDFKLYNDTLGHLEGDRALVAISSIIKNVCRREDLVCRYGGEEFAVILPEISLQDTYIIAERMRASVEGQRHLFKREVTISIGISSFPQGSVDKNSLISKADSCLYKAKQAGKNRVVGA
ncbi:MAG: sensor domain-containing diguanylate cyclase [Candidatus Omnitrophica bacterium]|nr:sensor domain-containing diguanylate cyclase [Candidatus Omnitrophota bacterium]